MSSTRLSVLLSVTTLLLGTAITPSAFLASVPTNMATIGDTNGVATPVGVRLPDDHFMENLGQLQNENVRFYISSGAVRIGLAVGRVLLAVVEHAYRRSVIPPPFGPDEHADSENSIAARGVLVQISFVNSRVVEPEGRGELPYRNNYFLGSDSSRWLTGVRNYIEVIYENLYDGIDLVFGMREGHLKYEFHVSPGADPRQIEMAYEGVDSLEIDHDGALVASTSVGEVRDLAPVAYEGKDEIKCPYSLRHPLSFGFNCEWRDISRPLVIDPLVYSTFIGGSDDDIPFDMAMDASRNVYVVGGTASPGFPATPGAFDVSLNGTFDGYIAKLNPDGGSLAWATFVGGSDNDTAHGVALDSIGNLYVTGSTHSMDFPVTVGAFDTALNGKSDAFVARFTKDGVLTWATYLGGIDNDQSGAIALDSSGNVVVSAETESPDFPVTPGTFNTLYKGFGDGYVTKLDPSGNLLWSAFLGGSGTDRPSTVTLGADDSIYAGGSTTSTDFPVTPGAFDTTYNGGAGPGDVFVARLTSNGSAIVWATYIGGAGEDGGGRGSLDGKGNLYVTGRTESANFPVTPGAFDKTRDGFDDAFVAKLNSSGGALLWATLLGGSSGDMSYSIVPDVAGDIWVSGDTSSTDFPATPGAFDTTLGGPADGFLAKLSSNGTSLLYATFIGGSGTDGMDGMALDSSGYAYLAGETWSADFPVTPGAFDTTYNGESDAFVMKIGPVGPPNTPPVLAWTGETNYVSDGLDPETGTTFTDFTYRVSYSDADNNSPAQIYVRIEKPLGTPYGTFPLSFDAWKGIPNNYTTGAIYTFSTKLPAGTDFWYYFRATDGWAWATGPPTIPIDAPDVVADNPPVAVAKASPTSAFMGDTITFDATASTDDFGITSYLWDFGDTATDTNPVTAHVYSSRGTFPATLTVWDTAGQNDTDTVSISIGNRLPTADAGPDQSVFKNDSVRLDGTGSSDPDGDSLTYQWNQTGGPPVALARADTATPSFSPAASGTYAFLLTVGDGWGGSSNDTVSVIVVNRAPTADAGPNRTVSKKSLVALDGTGSSDPDGDKLTFAWTQTGGPTVFLSGANTANPTFIPPRSGTYVFQLTVDDGDGGTSSDTVQVTATNAQPVAEAGPERSAQKNTSVTLDGSSSSDPDGDSLTFSWTQLSGPTATLTGADTATPSFTPTRAGTYTFRLRVDDGDGGASEDSTNVTVWGLPPTASLVANPPSVRVGAFIEFDGSGSTDPDGTIVDFSFSFGDNKAEGGIEAARNHSYAVPGTYTVTLTVTDDDGNTSMAHVTVEVTGTPPSVEANYKPLVALIFAIILIAAGVWSSKKRPWRGGRKRMAVAKAFLVTSMPFVIGEAATGVVSLLTGQLSMPPLVGVGTVIDIAILVAGIAVSFIMLLKNAQQKGKAVEVP